MWIPNWKSSKKKWACSIWEEQEEEAAAVVQAAAAAASDQAEVIVWAAPEPEAGVLFRGREAGGLHTGRRDNALAGRPYLWAEAVTDGRLTDGRQLWVPYWSYS